MTQWTGVARELLEDHFAKMRLDVERSGADADEVFEDLRSHIDVEIEAMGLEIVNAEDVRLILDRLGGGVPLQEQAPSEPEAPQAGDRNRVWEFANMLMGFKAFPWALLFGVILPLVAVGVEVTTRICRETFFDPLPTWGHVVAYAWVGIGTLVGLCSLGIACDRVFTTDVKSLKISSWCVGTACGIALVYTLIFLPIVPLSIIGIVVFGVGFCGLSPLIALLVTWNTHRKLKEASTTYELGPTPRLWKGVLVGMALMVLLEVPGGVTRIGLEMASSSNPATQTRGIRFLRVVGNENMLLRSCYFRDRNAVDLLGFLLNLNGRTTTEQSRKIYYQVTGRAFNTAGFSFDYVGRGRFDGEQGGAEVGGVIDDLTLIHSGIDSSIDAQAALAYTEWTMVFENSNPWRQREARTQIALPPGSVVSRLTLWVDGEEREAAFASRKQTRDAYTNVVRRQRDPVLVTTDGPDRILVQCFPVPTNGGQMKIRFGYTTPLTLNRDKNAQAALPKLLERNFKIQSDFKHDLWFESKRELSSERLELAGENPKEELFALRGEISTDQLHDYKSSVLVDRVGSPDVSWSKDLMQNSTLMIRQEIKKAAPEAPENVVFVIDSSQVMSGYGESVQKAFAALPEGVGVSVIVAGDEVLELAHKADSSSVDVARLIGSIEWAGGKDNVPALLRAWELASERSGSVIVWIHASQPTLLRSAQTLVNRFERRPDQVELVDFQVDVAPNRIAEELDGLAEVRSWSRFGDVENDLKRLFEMWGGQAATWDVVRTQTAQAPVENAKQTSTHLARLWAYDEVLRGWGEGKQRNRDEAVALAASYQLVTPLTGAVVLETAQQYQEAGLTPVAPGTVPGIPEPSTWLLLIVAAMVFGWLLLQRRRGVQ
jgi:hypothetical protein